PRGECGAHNADRAIGVGVSTNHPSAIPEIGDTLGADRIKRHVEKARPANGVIDRPTRLPMKFDRPGSASNTILALATIEYVLACNLVASFGMPCFAHSDLRSGGNQIGVLEPRHLAAQQVDIGMRPCASCHLGRGEAA